MELQVETYEAAPIGGGTQSGLEEIQSPEAQGLIESLGLVGQRGLLHEVAVGDDDSVTLVNPYRQMTVEEQRIFKAIAPAQTALEKYAAGPIPLRVLQVAAHAKPFFKRLEVWHPKEAVLDDPILVGYREDPDRTWREHLYILARWGVHLLPMEQLRTLAAERLSALWGSQIEREIGALDLFRRGLPLHLQSYLAGDSAGRDFALSLPTGPAPDMRF